ncbi:MAG TPA: hypothetical protein VGG64_13815 [Pirellulales bacterium]
MCHALKELSLVEEVLGAFDAPYHIEGLRIKCHLFGIRAKKLGSPGDMMPTRGTLRPLALYGANRDPSNVAGEMRSQVD